MVLTRGDDGQTTPDRETNGSLVSALAKAYHWQEQLESGEYAGLEDLAAANGVDRTYVGRMLRLTSLAPGIVERILGGDEPEGVSLRRLWKNLPAIWVEQNWWSCYETSDIARVTPLLPQRLLDVLRRKMPLTDITEIHVQPRSRFLKNRDPKVLEIILLSCHRRPTDQINPVAWIYLKGVRHIVSTQ